MDKKLQVSKVQELDNENKKLVDLMYKTKLKVGLEIGKRLKPFRDDELYKKLGDSIFPNFNSYLGSLGISYKSATELISLYESFIITSGYKIEELEDVGYHHLTTIKPMFFEKKDGEYRLKKPKRELNKWIKEAGVLTQADLKQKRMEEEVGEHEHKFEETRFRKCKVCKLREKIYDKS